MNSLKGSIRSIVESSFLEFQANGIQFGARNEVKVRQLFNQYRQFIQSRGIAINPSIKMFSHVASKHLVFKMTPQGRVFIGNSFRFAGEDL